MITLKPADSQNINLGLCTSKPLFLPGLYISLKMVADITLERTLNDAIIENATPEIIVFANIGYYL
jgi:hypothetical protein